MADIEALRARMREAAEKAMAATSDNWFHGEYSDIEYAPPAGDENGAHWFPLADELAPAVCDYLIAAQPSATIAIDAYTTRLRDDLDRVTRERDEAREAVDADEQVIAERDSYHEWADKLAHAVGGLEVGEHSNINNPWQNAIEMAETLHARAETAEAALAKRDEENARLRDKVDGLSADLDAAVMVAFKYGAKDWARLNYPTQYATLTKEPTNAG